MRYLGSDWRDSYAYQPGRGGPDQAFAANERDDPAESGRKIRLKRRSYWQDGTRHYVADSGGSGAGWVFLHNAPKRYSPVKTGARVIPSCVDVGPGL